MAKSKKKGFFLWRWLRRGVMGGDAEVRDILQEEQVQTPLRTVVNNFLHKKLAILIFFYLRPLQRCR